MLPLSLLLLACGAAPVSSAPVSSDPIAQMRTQPIAYTRHARCRMTCRSFDEDEVREVLASGRHVSERTRLDGECPSHALEGTTADGQRARMVFADCPGEARLVTAIDLGRDWPCDCD